MTDARLLVGGERVPGAGATLEVENPYTEQTIASAGSASDEQVDAALSAAREAAPGWAAIPAVERAELLHEVATRPFKQSGLGRELGREGLEAFQETKQVHMETVIAEKPWWYPYGRGGWGGGARWRGGAVARCAVARLAASSNCGL